MIEQVLIKLQTHVCVLTMVVPSWPNRPWFPLLLQSLIETPRRFAPWDDLIKMPLNDLLHRQIRSLGLHACRLSSTQPLHRVFLLRCQRESLWGSRRLHPWVIQFPMGAILSWCGEKDIYPLEVSVDQVCDLFHHLFSEGKAPVTIGGYRSAINSVWELKGRSLVSNHMVVPFSNSFKLERPCSRHTLLKWDLNLALRFLRRPEYSPDRIADNLGHFVSKTAFLTLLAVAWRCGDVQTIGLERVTVTNNALILIPFPGNLP